MWFQNCGKYISVSVNAEQTCCVCVCHDLQQEVQDNPHFLTKVITRNGTWDYRHAPETKQLLSQHECSDCGQSAYHIHSLRPSSHYTCVSWFIWVKYCKMVNGNWFIMTAHMLIQPHSWQEKENGATPSTSIPAWILIHVIYSCFQRQNCSSKKSHGNICKLYLMVLQRTKFKHYASDNGRLIEFGIWTPEVNNQKETRCTVRSLKFINILS
jgi:hypothetical protein